MCYKPTLKSTLDRDCTTLSRHVLQQLRASQRLDLSALMNRIALAGKIIARRLSRAGKSSDLPETLMCRRIRQKMDVYANDVFFSVFKQSGLVCRLASRKWKTILHSGKLSCG